MSKHTRLVSGVCPECTKQTRQKCWKCKGSGLVWYEIIVDDGQPEQEGEQAK